MYISPHRKTKGHKQNSDLWLPIGKKSTKGTDNQPGKSFKDPQGKYHMVPDQSLGRVGKKRRVREKKSGGLFH